MNEIEKLIAKALFKGFAHATIVPATIFYLTNYFVEGNWGGVAALIYIILSWYIYHKSTHKDLSKQAFNFSIMVITTFIWMIAILWLIGSLDS